MLLCGAEEMTADSGQFTPEADDGSCVGGQAPVFGGSFRNCRWCSISVIHCEDHHAPRGEREFFGSLLGSRPYKDADVDVAALDQDGAGVHFDDVSDAYRAVEVDAS
jgi:hypothetical protein